MIETLVAALSAFADLLYLEEILGGLVIVYLLIRLRRRKQKKQTHPDKSTPAAVSGKQYSEDKEDEKIAIYDDDADAGSSDVVIDEYVGEDDVDFEKPAMPEHNLKTGTIAETPAIMEPPVIPPPEKIIQKQVTEPEAPTPAGLFDRLKTGLSKTRQNFARRFEGILSGNRAMDDDAMEAIEEALITADVGVTTTMELMGRISAQADRITGPESFKACLKQEMLSFVKLAQPVSLDVKPYVIMMVGVNGAGKTTTIGKLAFRYAAEGKKVLLAAADTFRAAAADQLSIWAERSGADIVRHRDNADPAAVAYDGIEAAVSRGVDVVIVDTAGRLQTKINLMEQLKKIKRSIDKALPGAPHEVMLVLDATTGQNAVSQARLFDEGIGVTGIVLAKLDGTAKGGIVISICHTLKIPIRYIGIGEGVDDLQTFDPERFIDALL